MSAPRKSLRDPVSRSVAMERPGIPVNAWDLVRLAVVVLGTQAVIRLMVLMRQMNY